MTDPNWLARRIQAERADAIEAVGVAWEKHVPPLKSWLDTNPHTYFLKWLSEYAAKERARDTGTEPLFGEE